MIRQHTKETKYDTKTGEQKLVDCIQKVIPNELLENENEHLRYGLELSSSYREMFKKYLNRYIEISTTGGDVEGTICEVGDNYLEIQEPGGALVYVYLKNMIYYQAR
ncbi:hypothetical protein GCM10025859_66740 [Alicyclobacillus fastidiosus]|nr:hypothetical protein GCM10025859_66740 [Alicyclobacillus fastidiosus]